MCRKEENSIEKLRVEWVFSFANPRSRCAAITRSGSDAVTVSGPKVRAIFAQLCVKLTQHGQRDWCGLAGTAVRRSIVLGAAVHGSGDGSVEDTTVSSLGIAILLGRWLFIDGLMLLKIKWLIVIVVVVVVDSLAARGLGQASDSIVVAATVTERFDETVRNV